LGDGGLEKGSRGGGLPEPVVEGTFPGSCVSDGVGKEKKRFVRKDPLAYKSRGEDA